MPLIEWSPNLSVGVAEIDGQHQQLLSMLNRLYDTLGDPQRRHVVAQILDEAAEYAGLHFATEEKYMLQFSYPAYAEHKRLHDEFAVTIGRFRTELAEDRIGLTLDLGKYLLHWLYEHLMKEDMKYSSCFRSNGLR